MRTQSNLSGGLRGARGLRIVMSAAAAGLAAISGPAAAAGPATAPALARATAPDAAEYLIGAGDILQVFVWKNPELSGEAPVRPDGRVTTPLVQDIQAQGKTPTELAQNLRQALSAYIQDPVVTVVVKGFASPANTAAVRVIGAAVTPKTVPYRSGLTALDVLIDVGGLSAFANGNGATLLRHEANGYRAYPLRLKDLVNAGDLRANVNLMPGDIIRIPERLF